MSERLEFLFPNLRPSEYQITSPKSPSYNCVAWAAGDTSRNWDGIALGPDYWPENAIRGYGIAELVSAFATIGYAVCDDGTSEVGFEKIAFYGTDMLNYQHVARQLPDGAWTSKIGELEDITHESVDSLEGKEYGRVLLFMKRRTQRAN